MNLVLTACPVKGTVKDMGQCRVCCIGGAAADSDCGDKNRSLTADCDYNHVWQRQSMDGHDL